MNGKSGGPTTDRDASEPTPEELGREPGGTAGDAAQESGTHSPGGLDRSGEASGDGPDAIDLDSVHDRAS